MIIKCFLLSVTHCTQYLESDNLTIEQPSFSHQWEGNIKLRSCGRTFAERVLFFSFFTGKYMLTIWESLFATLAEMKMQKKDS